MTGPNSSHGVEESEKTKKSETDLYNELVNGFASNYILNGNLSEADKNQLIKDIMLTNSIPGSNIETQLQRFIAGKDEFTGLDLSKINIFQLRNKLSGAFFARKNNEERIKEQVLKDYQISPDNYGSQIKSHVSNLNDKELKDVLDSELKRSKFLETILGFKPETKDHISILPSISERESANRIARLSDGDKQSVKVVLDKVHFENKLDVTDMDILISTGYLNGSEVKELVKNFIPYISLQQAIDIGLINPQAAKGIRDTMIGDLAAENNVSLDTATESEIQTSLSLSDVLISTDDYLVSDADYVNLGRSIGFKNFAEDLARKNQEIHQQLRENGPSTFDALREGILGLQNPNLDGFEKFRDNSILKFVSLEDGEEHIQYVKLVGKDESQRNFSFKKVGSNSINLSANSEVEKLDYNTFFENLKTTKDKISVFTARDVEEKIDSGDILSSEFQSYSADDFSGADRVQKTEQIQDKYEAQLEREIQVARDDVEKNQGSTFHKAKLEAKEKELEDLRQSTIMPDVAAEKANLFQLTDKLDDIDPEGKSLGLEVGIFVETKENAFRISGIDFVNEKIILNGLNGNEELGFSDFVYAFKKQKAVRAKKIDNFDRLIERVGGKLEWGDYKTNSGKLVAKNVDHGGKVEDRKIEFLKGTKSDTLVKILSFNDGFVEIQRGEVEDTKIQKGKEKIDGHKLKIKGAQVESYSLNEFARFIESEELVPDWKLGKKGLEVSPDSPHNARTGGNTFGGVMWKSFVSGRMSLSELMAGGKMIPELVTEYLKKGSDIKSAKAALAMGKFLPKQMQDELLIKVERAESESMDKALEDLGKIDSWMAVKRIRDWLLDKNTPEYNKEAGLLFMLSKYGHLTAKGAMYPYRGKWLWYEAFGGRVNDKLFLKKKAEAKADNQVFSEETLMHFLMKEQCKDGHYSGIKRRSRLHKEFENKWKTGVEEEFEKGYKDASNKRTASKMVDEGMDEALGGTTTNALGWMKKAVERGGSLESMMEISFSLMFSGAVFDIDQTTYLKAKGLWDGDGQPVVSQRMMSSVPEMKIFNNTVLELSKDIEKNYPQYKGIQDRAQKIFDNISKRDSVGEPDRLKAANQFWKDYGKPISRALNFSLGDDPEFSKTDTIILRNKGKNDIYRQYYEKASNYVGEGNYFKEDFVDDWAGDTGIFGLNTYKLAEKYLVMDQGGAFKKGSPGKKVWEHMYGDINNTYKKIFIGETLDSVENKQAQIDHVTKKLEEISAALLSVHGGRPGILPSINSPTSHLGEQFNKWGVNVVNDLSDVSAKDIKAGEKRKYFENAAKNIIDGVNQDDSENGNTPSALKEHVKKRVAGVGEQGYGDE